MYRRLLLVVGLLIQSVMCIAGESPSLPGSTTPTTHPDRFRMLQPDGEHWVCDYLLHDVEIPHQPARRHLTSSQIEWLMQTANLPDNTQVRFSLGRFVRYGRIWRGPFILPISDAQGESFDRLDHKNSPGAPEPPTWNDTFASSPVGIVDVMNTPVSVPWRHQGMTGGATRTIGHLWRRHIVYDVPLFTTILPSGDTLSVRLPGVESERVLNAVGLSDSADYTMLVTIERYYYHPRRHHWSGPVLLKQMSKKAFDQMRVKPTPSLTAL